jgi:hypothetical protein
MVNDYGVVSPPLQQLKGSGESYWLFYISYTYARGFFVFTNMTDYLALEI